MSEAGGRTAARAGWVLCWAALCLAPALPAAVRPNVVLLMADDLGWGDTGYNGHPVLATPSLDAMSAAGLRFDRFYAASPVCSPTRGSVLTGRHPMRYGVFGANVGHLRGEEITLAEVLRGRGYRTGHFGKWHLGTLLPDFSGKGDGRDPAQNYSTPSMHGFEEWFSTEYSVASWDPYDPGHQVPGRGLRDGGPGVDPRVLYWHNGENVTRPLLGDDSRILMDRAIPFIEEAVAAGRPFLAVIWFHAPHRPVIGGPQYRARYAAETVPRQHYYAAVTAMDEQIGRLRGRLRQLGVAEDTLVWFCSDNGPDGMRGPVQRLQGSTGPLRGRKWSLYEGGVRVPGLVEWPARIGGGRATDFPVVTSDLFPTILAAIGEPLPAGRPYDGIDLLPAIDGWQRRRPRPIGFRFGNQASLLDDRYKLIDNHAGGGPEPADAGAAPRPRYELYDVVADPAESRDLAPDNPRTVERMAQALSEWQESCVRSWHGDDYPSPVRPRPAAAASGRLSR